VAVATFPYTVGGVADAVRTEVDSVKLNWHCSSYHIRVALAMDMDRWVPVDR